MSGPQCQDLNSATSSVLNSDEKCLRELDFPIGTAPSSLADTKCLVQVGVFVVAVTKSWAFSLDVFGHETQEDRSSACNLVPCLALVRQAHGCQVDQSCEEGRTRLRPRTSRLSRQGPQAVASW